MTGPYQPRGLSDDEQESIMTRVELTRKVLLLERERDLAREEALRYRDQLLKIAAECATCDGSGVVILSVDDREVILKTDKPIVKTEPCEDCAAVRALLFA
jgi:hypothetical protein